MSGEMMEPVRIQRKRTKGWRMPSNTIYVGRPSIWENEFTIKSCGSALEAVHMFEHDVLKFSCFHPGDYETWIGHLKGKNLACWCPPGQPCHADVLLKLANRPARSRGG